MGVWVMGDTHTPIGCMGVGPGVYGCSLVLHILHGHLMSTENINEELSKHF